MKMNLRLIFYLIFTKMNLMLIFYLCTPCFLIPQKFPQPGAFLSRLANPVSSNQ
ncbi:unnamed protein product [Amoebophrya sp. A25]|nr:unnamed protein product [Amoebophrya sp. A25]|eukprot:GSA25T00000484001.1